MRAARMSGESGQPSVRLDSSAGRSWLLAHQRGRNREEDEAGRSRFDSYERQSPCLMCRPCRARCARRFPAINLDGPRSEGPTDSLPGSSAPGVGEMPATRRRVVRGPIDEKRTRPTGEPIGQCELQIDFGDNEDGFPKQMRQERPFLRRPHPENGFRCDGRRRCRSLSPRAPAGLAGPLATNPATRPYVSVRDLCSKFIVDENNPRKRRRKDRLEIKVSVVLALPNLGLSYTSPGNPCEAHVLIRVVGKDDINLHFLNCFPGSRSDYNCVSDLPKIVLRMLTFRVRMITPISQNCKTSHK